MTSEICLSLEKIVFPMQLTSMRNVFIQILSDSGFQHTIKNRTVKNNMTNLFSQKIFLPQNTKELLVEVSNLKKNKEKERICDFYYRIDEVSLSSKKHTITTCNEKYTTFQLFLSMKLEIQFDTDTITPTETQFSQYLLPNFYKKKNLNIVCLEDEQQPIEISKIYSPKNISQKLIEFQSQQSWETKSEFSPKKQKSFFTQDNDGDRKILRKIDTLETLTKESLEMEVKPIAIKEKACKGNDIPVPKIYDNQINIEKVKEKSKFGNKGFQKLDCLVELKNYILLGGMVGFFSAMIRSHELLIF